jgi:TetR/AcrR family transcriptional regulator, ethionamide resistance regulator
MTVRAESSPRRRRRTPEAAQREIIEAAEGLLRERPFRELTVDEVMRRTELSRPSFYVYFRDRHELVLRVVQHLFQEILAPSNAWLGTDEGGPAEMREAMAGAVDVYQQQAHVLRALADAAADDPEVEAAYNGLINTFRDLVTDKIQQQIRSGRIAPLDAHEVSTALMWCAERYLYLTFAPGQDPDPDGVCETLSVVWTRTLYGSI